MMARNNGWCPDGTGVRSNGDYGRDIQRGDSYSVRFVRPDMRGSLITVSFYAVEYAKCLGEFAVQRRDEPARPDGRGLQPSPLLAKCPVSALAVAR
jgi:hypothetical protein